MFRDEKGKVWTEHGEEVSEPDAASIAWTGNEPSHEQYLSDKAAVQHLGGTITDIERYQVDTLGRIRDRMSDQDNPPSADEIEKFKTEIMEEMPESVEIMLADDNAKLNASPTAAVTIPKL
ncbi:hypothetical protein AUC70_05800 [Methyloceanibacter stevinii]|uniref:Uncharacterized protein n=1 Tax=Methyloceanibacter stevinii TaxID=1774970 RepID=A0A1E3VPI9_9HYPH|nr:hypothetical protein [Methyloceanibacter stevinii]ODR95211.1 hypothetical protein AUC70_05800 [Methyloceanibacter stevinii]